MAECALIDDGWTLTGKVERNPGLWPEVNFEYRPALPEEVQRYARAGRGNAADDMRRDTDMILAHLVSWDMAYKPRGAEDAVKVPLETKYLNKVHHRIRQQIIDHITGFTSPQLEADLKN